MIRRRCFAAHSQSRWRNERVPFRIARSALQSLLAVGTSLANVASMCQRPRQETRYSRPMLFFISAPGWSARGRGRSAMAGIARAAVLGCGRDRARGCPRVRGEGRGALRRLTLSDCAQNSAPLHRRDHDSGEGSVGLNRRVQLANRTVTPLAGIPSPLRVLTSWEQITRTLPFRRRANLTRTRPT